MKSIEERLKDLINSRYKSIRAFSIKLGMPYSTLDSIFKRGIANTSITNILKICDLLDISADYLAAGEIIAKDAVQFKLTPSEIEGVKKYRTFSDEEKGAINALFNYICSLHEAPKTSTVIELPLPMHTASAGYGDWADEDDSAEMVKVALDATTRKADFLFRISGDSMAPNIPDGSIVAVRRQSDVPVGKVGLFFSCEDGYFIKVRGKNGLESYNHNYPTIHPNGDSGVECRGLVLGVVEVVAE
jgi:SOS-response transcriptional repressor LexA